MSTIDYFKQLNDQYFEWLRSNTTLHSIDERWVEITTPFLDRHNDHLQIYASRNGNNITLSDDGYTISDLQMSGCDVTSPRRTAILKEILAGYNVQVVDDRLEVTGSAGNFPRHKHNLLQAMLAVDDMFYLAAPHVVSLFHYQAADWLNESEVRFSKDVNFVGKSGFSHKFFGVIPPSKQHPERVLRTINNPNTTSCRQFLFEWLDILAYRRESKLIVILNDEAKPVSNNVLQACQSYDITGVPWSQRKDYINVLAG